jgi:hypothetical protein
MYLQKEMGRKNCVQLVFSWHLEGIDENGRIRIQDPDPDPLTRGMDPRIRIHPQNVMDPQYWFKQRQSMVPLPNIANYANGLFNHPWNGSERNLSSVRFSSTK